MDNEQLTVTLKDIKPITERLENLEIISPNTLKLATTILSNANTYLDSVIAYKESKTKPLNQALKVIRAETKPLEEALESLIESIRTKMSKYQTELANTRLEAELAITQRIGEGRGKLKLETAVNKLEALAPVAQSVETDAGSVTFIATKKCEVVDMALLPLEYHVADETKVRSAMKQGVELPGVRYWTEQIPRNVR